MVKILLDEAPKDRDDCPFFKNGYGFSKYECCVKYTKCWSDLASFDFSKCPYCKVIKK